MDESTKALVLILVSNFPLIVGFIILQQRGVVEIPGTKAKELRDANQKALDQKQAEVDFREALRQELLKENLTLKEGLINALATMKELNVAVRNSLEFQQRLVDKFLDGES